MSGLKIPTPSPRNTSPSAPPLTPSTPFTPSTLTPSTGGDERPPSYSSAAASSSIHCPKMSYTAFLSPEDRKKIESIRGSPPSSTTDVSDGNRLNGGQTSPTSPTSPTTPPTGFVHPMMVTSTMDMTGVGSAGPSSLTSKFLLDNDLFTDVTFIVEGKRLKAHRIVLALKSDVFHNMFSSQKDETTFTIKDTTFPAFQELLNYVYTNKCNAVSVDTTIRLLGLAEQYHFKELKKACLNHVMKKLSPDTAVEALIVGNTYGIDKVKSAALKVIKRNKVSELKNWDKLRGHDTLKDQVCVYLQGYNN